MNTLHECCRPVFGRHETFHPRWGWFSKGVAEGKNNPFVFLEKDAPLQLGVGKNMVRAIRYWGEASTLLMEVKPPKERLAGSSPTRRGQALLDPDNGADPYLEIKGSLWLLHWWMLQPDPTSMVPLAWFAFNTFRPQEFNASDLEQAFYEECLKGGGEWRPVNTTLSRDSHCFLRTYVATDTSHIDDALDAPLRELGLLSTISGQKRRYRFQSPAWIEPLILLYTCADFLCSLGHGGRTVTLTRLLQEINSPGRVLRISEEQLIKSMQDRRLSSWIDLNDSMGTLQVILKAPIESIRWQSLAAFYGCNEQQARDLVEGGKTPLYKPESLHTQVQALKTSRMELHTIQKASQKKKVLNDLPQRMALSAEIFKAGLRQS